MFKHNFGKPLEESEAVLDGGKSKIHRIEPHHAINGNYEAQVGWCMELSEGAWAVFMTAVDILMSSSQMCSCEEVQAGKR